jgi:hypothetical protein
MHAGSSDNASTYVVMELEDTICGRRFNERASGTLRETIRTRAFILGAQSISKRLWSAAIPRWRSCEVYFLLMTRFICWMREVPAHSGGFLPSDDLAGNGSNLETRFHRPHLWLVAELGVRVRQQDGRSIERG